MTETMTIKNLKKRIEDIENILTAITAGEIKARINSGINDEFTGVENGINVLIDNLTTELEKRKEIQKELDDKLATIQELQQVISKQQDDLLELSTPVTKVWEDILILPIIGTLDSRRTQIMTENLLQKIVETGCTTAILDITGVSTLDTEVANHLIKTITAAKLLGAECILSGISPAIAQTIVHLGIDLSFIKTKATMQEAMRYAMKKNNYQVVEIKSGESHE